MEPEARPSTGKLQPKLQRAKQEKRSGEQTRFLATPPKKDKHNYRGTHLMQRFCQISLRTSEKRRRHNRWNAWARKDPQIFGTPPLKDDIVSFEASDADGVNFPHNDPLVVEVMIADCKVSRVMVDTKSLVNLIFRDTLQK